MSLRSRLERDFLPFVEKPLRYLGNELNMVRKDPEQISLHGVLCFPDVYDIGMSHHGTQILYHVVNRRQEWALSRCYHPWPDAEVLLRDKQLPLYALEQCCPLIEADWLGFTVQYELQYTNILNMLDLAGMPLLSTERDERFPVVIAGGPCMVNPEPLAAFVDAFAIGDGERVIEQMCETIAEHKAMGSSRTILLKALGGLQGVYVPSLHEIDSHALFSVPVPGEQGRVEAAKIPQLDAADYPDRPLVPLVDITHNRLSVEVMRGCTRGCRFCSAGMYYRPVRERSPDSIAAQICECMETTGWRETGLLSLSTADYTGLPQLLQKIGELKQDSHLKVSLPSTRIDALTPEQFGLLKRVTPVSSVTIAPEAGSQRLRNVINKDFSEQAILDTVTTLLENNVQTVKLYFMVGLPTETDSDIDEMIRLIRQIAAVARTHGRRRQVNVAVSPFSPKASTPFQWEAMTSVALLLERSRKIKRELSELRNVKVSYRDPNITLLETVMARGDRKVGALIHKARELGARFDGWDEHFNIARWNEAARQVGLSFDPYLSEIPLQERLPWDMVSSGVTKEFLLQERSKALHEEASADCRGQCAACGLQKLCRSLPVAEASDGAAARKPSPSASSESLQKNMYWFRCRFLKVDAARFLSHRDTMNLMHRAFLASGTALAFSQGFNPHPKMSFGPPLMLGAQGAQELFDVALQTSRPPDCAAINRLLPRGLQITGVDPMPGKPQSLMSIAVAARYRFEPLEPLAAEQAREAVMAFMNSESVEVMQQRAGKGMKDIRPLVDLLRVVDKDEKIVIEGILSLRGGATCRPEELLRALFPDHPWATFLMTRLELLQG